MAQKKIEKLGQYTNDSVLKHTGKSWMEWIKVLNNSGAAHLTHKEIVAHLKKKYKLTLWWQQIVTSGYEVFIGRRIEGQNIKGEYTTTITKTFPLNQKALWQILVSPEGQKYWLAPMTPLEVKPKSTFEVRGGIFGAIRTMKEPTRIRMSWEDSDWSKRTTFSIYLNPQPSKKCMLIFNHEGLLDTRSKEKMKTHWRQAIESLFAYASKTTKE